MSWVNPITDRTITDINTRTSKAFFNVADWIRIDGNNRELQTLIENLLSLVVSLETLTPPTITHFPTAEEINALIENINRLREAACLPEATGATALKSDYLNGNGTSAPNYEAVNAWEEVQRLIYTLLPNASQYKVYCGVAATGQPRLWQARFRG
jgi:hypothetical protein